MDSGADGTLLPEQIAADIGVDLSACPVFTAAGLNAAPSSVRYALVTLKLPDGVEFRSWPTEVGFVSGPMRRAVLGFGSCLQFFTATFYGDREFVTLETNSLYPGT